MGIMRKLTSLSTLGLVSYRTDGERQAKYARQTRNATRAQVAQNAAMLDMQRNRLAQAQSHHEDDAMARQPPPYQPQLQPPMVAAPGWYPDGQGAERWFDGYVWTPFTR